MARPLPWAGYLGWCPTRVMPDGPEGPRRVDRVRHAVRRCADVDWGTGQAERYDGPYMILHDGGDATLLVHQGVAAEKNGAVTDDDFEEYRVVLDTLPHPLGIGAAGAVFAALHTADGADAAAYALIWAGCALVGVLAAAVGRRTWTGPRESTAGSPSAS